jgi:K+-sensing histidine kinase KdpD
MRKLTAYVITLVPLAALYSGVMLLSFHLYPGLPLYTVIVLAVSLALLLALIGFPIRRPIQVFVNRIFYRETYDHRQTLLNFTSKMGYILNLDQLASEILLMISKAIRISPAILLLEDRSGGSFSTQFVYPKSQDKPDNELHFSSNSPIVALFQKEYHPLSVRHIESIVELKDIGPEERCVLGNLELICPLKSHGKLVGILGLGKKQSDKLYSQDDLGLVMNTTGQAGVILENALLYNNIIRDAGELKASNEKLIALGKSRIDSLSQELSEPQSPLIAIQNGLESMLSEKYGAITTAQRAQLQILLDSVIEERKLIDNLFDQVRIQE